ncbi:hypothetical protein AB0P41_12030 [Streptomyces sp. NPDC079167]|uniref:hypothetical protein n=1 Tax=Streptomyces sp. NPDC079167 TaxID=3154513 RepID=UPI0034457D60
MAALDGGSLTFLTIRESEDEKGRYWDVGVIGHGEAGAGSPSTSWTRSAPGAPAAELTAVGHSTTA